MTSTSCEPPQQGVEDVKPVKAVIFGFAQNITYFTYVRRIPVQYPSAVRDGEKRREASCEKHQARTPNQPDEEHARENMMDDGHNNKYDSNEDVYV